MKTLTNYAAIILGIFSAVMLALATCRGATGEPVDATPEIARTWELLGRADAPPPVEWAEDCFIVDYEGSERCVYGYHELGRVWVTVRGDGVWDTSLAHEFLHALNWRDT